jgi:hypothetical protein
MDKVNDLNDAKMTFLLPSDLKRRFQEKMKSIQSTPSLTLRAFIEECVNESPESTSNQNQ